MRILPTCMARVPSLNFLELEWAGQGLSGQGRAWQGLRQQNLVEQATPCQICINTGHEYHQALPSLNLQALSNPPSPPKALASHKCTSIPNPSLLSLVTNLCQPNQSIDQCSLYSSRWGARCDSSNILAQVTLNTRRLYTIRLYKVQHSTSPCNCKTVAMGECLVDSFLLQM